MKKERNCSNCKHTNKAEDEFPCSVCIRNYIDKYEPITNYDRIKSMSVEEMAVFFAKINASLHRANLPVIAYRGEVVNENIDWLLQEVSENDR